MKVTSQTMTKKVESVDEAATAVQEALKAKPEGMDLKSISVYQAYNRKGKTYGGYNVTVSYGSPWVSPDEVETDD